jgi:hypothetical protein
VRGVIRWVIIVGAALLVIGLMAEARGDKHHRGDQVGSHGTKVVVVVRPPG